ncbi:hypothetical protein [Mariniblastus fucicola]|nr:hypothetical protein [Mariniblastus fucicola]
MNTESNDEPQKAEKSEEQFVAELISDWSDSQTPAEQNSPPQGSATSAISDTEIVDAEAVVAATVVPSVAYDPTVLVPRKISSKSPPSPMAHLAAKGGAVGAIVLGVLSFAGSFITSYAILNSFMGLALGLWGLKSNHRKMAMVGILLCLISAFFCAVEISGWLQSLWPNQDL